MDIPKYFSNVVLAQFKATGIPLKVYVNDQYLIIPDMYEISDPLIGSGMTPAGDMIQFDYREIDHLLVGGNVIDLATYTKAMIGDTPEEDAKENEAEDEAAETTEESLELGEITKDVLKARQKALDAEEDALKDKQKALKDEPITEDGLWANIHAKRKRGEKPAPKGSKAYKAAKKAGDKINNESVNEEVDKAVWSKANDDQRIGMLLTIYDDPDEAELYVDSDWDNLPPEVTSNLRESVNEDYDKMLDRRYGRSRDYNDIEIKDVHFQTDADELEKMKLAYGYRLGGMTSREKIEDAEYELRRYRKTIKYDTTGKDLGVFRPGSYMAATSKLGDGPHKKAVKKIKWTQKEYDQWLEDVASNDGWKNASDMAQNAKNEPGLIDWVKKNNRGEDAMQRIQWDIEAFAESVVNEEVDRPEEKKTAILNAIAKEEKRSEFQNRILNQIKRAIVDGEPLFKLPFKTQADYRKLMKMYKIPFSSKKAEKGNLRAESVIKKGSYVTNKDGLVGRVDNISGDKEIADIRYNDDTEDSLPIKNLKIFEKSMNEAWIGPFVFGNTTKDDELKAMYNGALDGYANWKNGMVHPRADYKKAYQTIEKLLKRRGIQVESIKEDHAPIDSISEPYMFQVGDFIKNTNTSCDHFGSMGIIQKMFKLADKMIVKYRVVNNGDTFKPGDVLSKTSDQLDPIG
tara:strand:+ start:44833 stop:46890 length:2058 start_codon:yes stop_codon:yes gene_type:complete